MRAARGNAIRPGLWIAIAAVAVSAPRLVIAFLEADGLALGPDLRGWLVATTGVATAAVLGLGNAYLAHAVASTQRHRGLLAVLWLLSFTAVGALVSPVLVAGIRGEGLGDVLASNALHWAWSIVAVAAVELCATGCIVADVSRSSQQSDLAAAESRLFELAQERNKLAQELAERGGESQEPAQARAQCPSCQEWFASQQAVNAHRRWCSEREEESAA